MPKRNYRQKTTGKTVKGVTTILKILNQPWMPWWAYNQGMSNFERLMVDISYLSQFTAFTVEDYKALIEGLIKDFKTTGLYDKRDKAANAGTLAHALIEDYLQGYPDPDFRFKWSEGKSKDIINKVEGCFLTFLDWEKSNLIHVIDSEVELTSEVYPYGGTIDHIIQTAFTITYGDSVEILDIKTGKDIYLEAKIQVKSYGKLWEEYNPESSLGGFHILRLGENGEFTHKYFPSLDEKYFKIFLDLLDVTETLSQLGEKL